MTCILGMASKGRVYIGGDSAGVDEYWHLTIRRDPKVFRVGQFIVGFTASWRMGQLIRYHWLPPAYSHGDIFRYVASKAIPSLRLTLNEGGFAAKKENRETGGVFLIGYTGRLFTVFDDYQVAEAIDDRAAIGCGGPFGLGALHALQRLSPRRAVLRALSISEQCSAGVRRPFKIVSI